MILGVGVDLVDLSRIRRVIDRWEDRFRTRIFTHEEITLCVGRKHPVAAFAMRFAAKEALSKALGTGFRQGVVWRDIEVVHNEQGKPDLVFHGRVRELAAEQGVRRAHVSLSDDGRYAVAVVVLEGDDAGGYSRTNAKPGS